MKRWSKKNPSEPGFYWYKETAGDEPTVVRIQRHSYLPQSGFHPDLLVLWFIGNECEKNLSDVSGLWKHVEGP